MISNSNWPQNLIIAVFGEETPVNTLRLDAWLGHLSEREKDVTLKRYRDGMTLEAIGNEYQVTRERVRQVEYKALRRLKHPSLAKEVLMVSLEEHEAALSKAKEDYEKLFAEHNALRRHVKELHEAVAEELPALKGIFRVMSKEIISGGIPDVPIEELELSVRSHACLARHGIKTAREIERMTMEEIQKVRNLGLKSVDEIRGRLIDFGFEPKF